jgi:hypothetical protein
MVRVTVVVWVMPPPVAVTVMVWVPRAEFLPTVTFMLEEPDPGAPIDAGLKVTVWPLPCPEAESEIAELKPPVTVVVMVDEPEALLATVIEVGEAETVNAGWTAAVTVRERVVDCVSPPPVPVTVMG